MDATYLRFFTFTSARRLVTGAGLAIRAERPNGRLPWWRLRAALPADLVARADQWVVRRRPDLLACEALFVASPLDRAALGPAAATGPNGGVPAQAASADEVDGGPPSMFPRAGVV